MAAGPLSGALAHLSSSPHPPPIELQVSLSPPPMPSLYSSLMPIPDESFELSEAKELERLHRLKRSLITLIPKKFDGVRGLFESITFSLTTLTDYLGTELQKILHYPVDVWLTGRAARHVITELDFNDLDLCIYSRNSRLNRECALVKQSHLVFREIQNSLSRFLMEELKKKSSYDTFKHLLKTDYFVQSTYFTSRKIFEDGSGCLYNLGGQIDIKIIFDPEKPKSITDADGFHICLNSLRPILQCSKGKYWCANPQARALALHHAKLRLFYVDEPQNKRDLLFRLMLESRQGFRIRSSDVECGLHGVLGQYPTQALFTAAFCRHQINHCKDKTGRLVDFLTWLIHTEGHPSFSQMVATAWLEGAKTLELSPEIEIPLALIIKKHPEMTSTLLAILRGALLLKFATDADRHIEGYMFPFIGHPEQPREMFRIFGDGREHYLFTGLNPVQTALEMLNRYEAFHKFMSENGGAEIFEPLFDFLTLKKKLISTRTTLAEISHQLITAFLKTPLEQILRIQYRKSLSLKPLYHLLKKHTTDEGAFPLTKKIAEQEAEKFCLEASYIAPQAAEWSLFLLQQEILPERWLKAPQRLSDLLKNEALQKLAAYEDFVNTLPILLPNLIDQALTRPTLAIIEASYRIHSILDHKRLLLQTDRNRLLMRIIGTYQTFSSTLKSKKDEEKKYVETSEGGWVENLCTKFLLYNVPLKENRERESASHLFALRKLAASREEKNLLMAFHYFEKVLIWAETDQGPIAEIAIVLIRHATVKRSSPLSRQIVLQLHLLLEHHLILARTVLERGGPIIIGAIAEATKIATEGFVKNIEQELIPYKILNNLLKTRFEEPLKKIFELFLFLLKQKLRSIEACECLSHSAILLFNHRKLNDKALQPELFELCFQLLSAFNASPENSRREHVIGIELMSRIVKQWPEKEAEFKRAHEHLLNRLLLSLQAKEEEECSPCSESKEEAPELTPTRSPIRDDLKLIRKIEKASRIASSPGADKPLENHFKAIIKDLSSSLVETLRRLSTEEQKPLKEALQHLFESLLLSSRGIGSHLAHTLLYQLKNHQLIAKAQYENYCNELFKQLVKNTSPGALRDLEQLLDEQMKAAESFAVSERIKKTTAILKATCHLLIYSRSINLTKMTGILEGIFRQGKREHLAKLAHAGALLIQRLMEGASHERNVELALGIFSQMVETQAIIELPAGSEIDLLWVLLVIHCPKGWKEGVGREQLRTILESVVRNNLLNHLSLQTLMLLLKTTQESDHPLLSGWFHEILTRTLKGKNPSKEEALFWFKKFMERIEEAKKAANIFTTEEVAQFIEDHWKQLHLFLHHQRYRLLLNSEMIYIFSRTEQARHHKMAVELFKERAIKKETFTELLRGFSELPVACYNAGFKSLFLDLVEHYVREKMPSQGSMARGDKKAILLLLKRFSKVRGDLREQLELLSFVWKRLNLDEAPEAQALIDKMIVDIRDSLINKRKITELHLFCSFVLEHYEGPAKAILLDPLGHTLFKITGVHSVPRGGASILYSLPHPTKLIELLPIYYRFQPSLMQGFIFSLSLSTTGEPDPTEVTRLIIEAYRQGIFRKYTIGNWITDEIENAPIGIQIDLQMEMKRMHVAILSKLLESKTQKALEIMSAYLLTQLEMIEPKNETDLPFLLNQNEVACNYLLKNYLFTGNYELLSRHIKMIDTEAKKRRWGKGLTIDYYQRVHRTLCNIIFYPFAINRFKALYRAQRESRTSSFSHSAMVRTIHRTEFMRMIMAELCSHPIFKTFAESIQTEISDLIEEYAKILPKERFEELSLDGTLADLIQKVILFMKGCIDDFTNRKEELGRDGLKDFVRMNLDLLILIQEVVRSLSLMTSHRAIIEPLSEIDGLVLGFCEEVIDITDPEGIHRRKIISAGPLTKKVPSSPPTAIPMPPPLPPVAAPPDRPMPISSPLSPSVIAFSDLDFDSLSL